MVEGVAGAPPEVAWLDARLGGSLLRAGRAPEAYPLLRRVAAEWTVDDSLLPDLALAAHRTGREAEARAALARAQALLAGWPGRLDDVNREIMGVQ